MNNQALILDLDDTIFPTKSMDKEIFRPFFDDLTATLAIHFDSQQIENIIEELWERPIDYVFNKHNIKYDWVSSLFTFFDTIDLKLDIQTYQDYCYLRSNELPKYLVTTGIKNLQSAKIRALGIENDFDNIYIIDSISNSKSKNFIFRQIVQDYKLKPNQIFVIGDNPDSEIESGNIEQMITIQILREKVKKGTNADYYIKSFYDLNKILSKENE